MVKFTWSPRKFHTTQWKHVKTTTWETWPAPLQNLYLNPKGTINISPSDKALRLLELQFQHVQELQHDVLEAHPKQAAGRFPVYHAARFSDIQSGRNITSWNMLEPLHGSSWHRKSTHQYTSCFCMWLLILRASDIHYKKISPRISLQNVDTCGYQLELSSSHV